MEIHKLLDEAVERVLAGEDLLEVEMDVLEALDLLQRYEGIVVPERFTEERPAFRAWLRMRYGPAAEEFYRVMSGHDKDLEWDTMERWLKNPDASLRDFLALWREELKRDVKLILAGTEK